MRILVAPDCFGGTLTAAEAAGAIAAGWAGSGEVDRAPMSDGGPGFVEVLAGLGEVRTAEVTGPLGAPVTARWRLHGTTAYVESAQACGLHLVATNDPEAASTAGVGELLAAVLAAGVTRVVVGLGGSATTDGGAGLLAAVPAVPPGVELLAATDVDNPLLGEHGAARVFGPQKGADGSAVARLERRLRTLAAGRPEAELPGAGAAGGLGFALYVLGARRVSGADLVARVLGLDRRVAAADLVVTGEGRFDRTSLRGKVVGTVAGLARARDTPCVVLAGQVALGECDAAAAGVSQAWSLVSSVGAVAAYERAAESLEGLSRRVAARWTGA